jgi:uncharacterized protein (TIGR03437 family)
LTVIAGSGPVPLTPKPFANGVVDAADFIPFGEPGHAVAPKSIVSIFGADFVVGGEFQAETIPLPTTLGGVIVLFDGIRAPLFFVSSGVIIAQIPMGLTPATTTMVIIGGENGGAASAPQQVQVAEHSPGVFTLSQDGKGQGIAVHTGSADLAAPLGAVGNSRPASEGDHLTIYANGLGPVEPPIEDGQNSCDPDSECLPDFSNLVLRRTTTRPVVTIGGVRVPAEDVVFSGPAPLYVGVNELMCGSRKACRRAMLFRLSSAWVKRKAARTSPSRWSERAQRRSLLLKAAASWGPVSLVQFVTNSVTCRMAGVRVRRREMVCS